MKLQPKMLLVFCSLTLLVGAPSLWTVRTTVHQILLDDVKNRGLSAASDLTRDSWRGYKAHSEHLFLPPLQSAQERAAASYAAALGLSGEVLAHTNVAEKGKVYNDVVTLEALRAGSTLTRISHTQEGALLLILAPVWSVEKNNVEEEFLFGGGNETLGKTRLGTVRLAIPLKKVLETEYRLFRKITVIVVTAGGASLLLILIFMRRLLLPIKSLSEGTSRISHGEYGINVPVFSRDELGQLANDFNQMSKALAETTISKDYLGNILSHMIDPLIVLSMDGIIQTANQAVLDLLGYAKQELEGQPAHTLFSAKDHLSSHGKQGTVITDSSVRNLEAEFITRSGARVPVLFSSSVLKNNEGVPSGIVVVAKDITERKHMESIIRQADKMSAVGQLAAGVAHEINNPLGIILGFAQAMVRRLRVNDPLEMPLKSIEKEAIRCKNLVKDLLTFSRTSKAEREPIDINRAIEEALPLIIAQARLTHIEVKQDLAPNLPHLLGNLNQIQQIIVNLSNNAFDAMGDRGGNLTVKTEIIKADPYQWICLRVTDTGVGIPSEILSRVFEPFFTTKPVGKGTGLGLSLIHEIVKKHSGTIDVESRPGCTEFCIKFPVH
ncbi:MAG: ATP-binding protein [Elusimicrobiota bacterium]|jgi:PAS domain S-box-containing protein